MDLETDQKLEVIPDYVKTQYRAKIDRHLQEMEELTRAAGMGYHQSTTDKPGWDRALTEYLVAAAVRRYREPAAECGEALDGISRAMAFWRDLAAVGLPGVRGASAAEADDGAAKPGSSLVLFEQETEFGAAQEALRYLLLLALLIMRWCCCWRWRLRGQQFFRHYKTVLKRSDKLLVGGGG